jgi:predicted transcriptional regulator YdeE/predicted transcriptional regulator
MQSFIIESVEELSDLFKTLYNPKRLELLALLLNEQKEFSNLMEESEVQKSVLGNHLSILLEKNLIKKLDRGVYNITTDGQELLTHIATSFLNAKIREQERLDRQRRKYQEIISRYTHLEYKNGELLANKVSEPKMGKVKIKTLPAISLLGIRDRGIEPKKFILPLWDKFHERFDEIKNNFKSNDTYGVSYEINKETKEFCYLIGCEIKEDIELPKDMVIYDIPAHTYSVIECTIPNMREAWNFLDKWIKDNGYTDISPPEFEFYPEKFENEETDSMYIYVPIKTN